MLIENHAPRVSVIIPTLNADTSIGPLLQKVSQQTLPPIEIIVADSESTDNTVNICGQCGVTILPIQRSQFNHGGTRDYALRMSCGEFILFMTQDALPCDNALIERMLDRLIQSPKIAAVYGRQLPKENATYVERLVREYNYPDHGHIYAESDIQEHGIRTFFMSDVCAMYRRDAYLDVGGFETDIKTNEDMLFAASAIRSGYSVGYVAEAKVFHSHNFSLKEQYVRNYAQGYEIERHIQLLEGISQNSAGMKMVKELSKKLFGAKQYLAWIYFGFDCCARYAGSYMGRKKMCRDRSKNLVDRSLN